MDEIVLLHRPKSPGLKTLANEFGLSMNHWLPAETCLRQMSFGLKSRVPAAVRNHAAIEIYEGASLIRFCLEMACGLFSPIVGETEVFGQFRSFFGPERVAGLSWRGQAESFSREVFSQVKELRQKHLIGIGSQSYGSVARRFITPDQPVLVIGGGQLAQEILPWVSKVSSSPVDVLVRREEQLAELNAQFNNVRAHTWQSFSSSVHSVIIAAPVPADQLRDWMQSLGLAPSQILDLREESAYDSLESLAPEVLPLAQVFEEMQKTKERLEPVLLALRSDINVKVLNFLSRASYRPFGWDDLCA